MVVHPILTQQQFDNFRQGMGLICLLFHNRMEMPSIVMKTFLTESAISYDKIMFVSCELESVFKFYNVTVTPTVIFFQDQVEKDRIVGNLPADVHIVINRFSKERIRGITHSRRAIIIMSCSPDNPDEDTRKMMHLLGTINADYGVYDTTNDRETYDTLYQRFDPPYPQLWLDGKAVGILKDVEKAFKQTDFVSSLPRKSTR